jgi:hypothetical protein
MISDRILVSPGTYQPPSVKWTQASSTGMALAAQAFVFFRYVSNSPSMLF